MSQTSTGNTKLFNIDASGGADAYTVQGPCRRIVFSPTDGISSYKYRKPGATSDAVTVRGGLATVLERPAPGQYGYGQYGDTGYFLAGDTPIYFESVSGTVEMQADEQI